MCGFFLLLWLWFKEEYICESSTLQPVWGDEANTALMGSFRLTPERATFSMHGMSVLYRVQVPNAP